MQQLLATNAKLQDHINVIQGQNNASKLQEEHTLLQQMGGQQAAIFGENQELRQQFDEWSVSQRSLLLHEDLCLLMKEVTRNLEYLPR